MVGMMHQEKLNGRVDRACVEVLQQRLQSVMEVCGVLELDAADVTYVSSDGFRMLMRLCRTGEVTVIRARPELCDQFEAAGMAGLIRQEKLTDRLSRLLIRKARSIDALPVRHRMAWQPGN